MRSPYRETMRHMDKPRINAEGTNKLNKAVDALKKAAVKNQPATVNKPIPANTVLSATHRAPMVRPLWANNQGLQSCHHKLIAAPPPVAHPEAAIADPSAAPLRGRG